MTSPDSLLEEIKNTKPDSPERQNIADSISHDLITAWLNNPSWKIRNIGVKIIGELRLSEFTEILAKIVTDRTPAKLIDRMLGGDYYQVGFIRRNAAYALGCMDTAAENVTSALLEASQDRYWEVRAEAFNAMRRLYVKNVPSEILDTVSQALQDKSFEVVAQAVCTLGELATRGNVVYNLRKTYDHPNIIVKTVVVETLKKLHERGVIKDKAELSSELKNIFIPGIYFLINNKK